MLYPDLQALQDQQVTQDHKVQPDRLVLQEIRVHQVSKDCRVLKVRQDLPER